MRNLLQPLRTSLSISLLLALAISAPASPQRKGGPAPIRVTPRVVNVNVVVTDKQGNPVKDLTQDDFTISDEGRPQKVALFSPIDGTQSNVPQSPPDPDTFTNRLADSVAPPSVTVLLFDCLAGRKLYTDTARLILRQLRPQDHVGIYVLSWDLKVVHDFRRDSADIVEVLLRDDQRRTPAAIEPSDEVQERDSAGDTEMDRLLARQIVGFTSPRPTIECFPMRMTMATVEAVTQELASVRGRKTLIWVTPSLSGAAVFEDEYDDSGGGGWFDLQLVSTCRSEKEIKHMQRLMSDVGISLYAVIFSGPEVNDPWRKTLAHIAERTGGRAFYKRVDPEIGIRQALNDSQFSYSLGYYPDHDHWKGEWRNIQVKVDRPEVTVLARTGYYAMPHIKPLSGKKRIQYLNAIAASPIDSTQLPLTIHLAASGQGTEDVLLKAQAHLDVVPMLTARQNGRWTGHFELIFMQLGKTDILLDVTRKDVDPDLTPEEYAKVSQAGWEEPAQLKIMPGADVLCVIVHDENTDAVGSVHIPLARYRFAPASR